MRKISGTLSVSAADLPPVLSLFASRVIPEEGWKPWRGGGGRAGGEGEGGGGGALRGVLFGRRIRLLRFRFCRRRRLPISSQSRAVLLLLMVLLLLS